MLVTFAICFVCLEWQAEKNEEIRLERLQAQIKMLKDENERQDALIGSIIRAEAMHGYFDSKEPDFEED